MTHSDDDDLLAGELALGLLDGPELASAEARAGADPDFAALVETWRQRFAPMLTGTEQEPPEHVWRRIEAQLAANDDAPLSDAERALRRWRAFGITASAIAASLALVLVTGIPQQAPAPQSPPQPEAPAPMMVATLQAEDGPAIVTISADPSGRMLVTPVSLPTGSQVPELWIIPDDGKPRSLGVIQAAQPSAMQVPAGHMPHVRRGATFAISREPQGGSPTGAPTGPVIVSGKIDTV
jgi:anti-sigma-K factor RskA